LSGRVQPERSTHPFLFLLMFVPMGISNGYVTVTLGFLLAGAGVAAGANPGQSGRVTRPTFWRRNPGADKWAWQEAPTALPH